VTIVVITHELSSIHAIADRVLMLHDGKTMYLGSLDGIKDCPIPEVQKFFRREPEHTRLIRT